MDADAPLPQATWGDDLGFCEWHRELPAHAACAGCERRGCAHCLSEAPAPGHGPGEQVTVAVCPACAHLYGVPSSVPFEQEERSFFGGFCTTWGWAVAKPNQLWLAFPHGGAGRATLFAILAALPVTLLMSCCLGGIFLAVALDSRSGTVDEETRLALVIGLGVVWGLTVIFPLGLAMLSLPVQLACRIGGSTTPWSATYRMLCYLMAVRMTAIPASLVAGVFASIIPGGQLLGNLGPEIWHSIVLYHGVRRVHGVSRRAAVLAALLPPLVLCALSLAPIVIFLAAVM